MCDYWISNVMSADNRTDADSCVPHHDILYYRYSTLDMLDKPPQSKNASGRYGIAERDLLVTHDTKEPHRVPHGPDFGKVNSGVPWNFVDPCVYNDEVSMANFFESGYTDGIGVNISNESLQNTHEIAAHSIRDGGEPTGHSVKLESDRTNFQGYHLSGQNLPTCDGVIPLHQGFLGEGGSSIFGNFVRDSYVTSLCSSPTMRVNPEIMPKEGVPPSTDQDCQMDQRSRCIILSPLTRGHPEFAKSNPITEREDGRTNDRCAYAQKNKSPSSNVTTELSNTGLRKNRNNFVGLDMRSPSRHTRIHERKSFDGKRHQRLPCPLEDAVPNNGARRITSPVVTNEYCKVRVFEIICNGVRVMLRKIDGYVNATQILKAAGIEKGKRIRILDREVARGDHEKVQGGCGKYQGTWVPFEKGLHLASVYGIDEELGPLFDLHRSSSFDHNFNSRNNSPPPKTTTKKKSDDSCDFAPPQSTAP